MARVKSILETVIAFIILLGISASIIQGIALFLLSFTMPFPEGLLYRSVGMILTGIGIGVLMLLIALVEIEERERKKEEK
jgi:hypothetical protein